jgi:hypothetical protein
LLSADASLRAEFRYSDFEFIQSGVVLGNTPIALFRNHRPHHIPGIFCMIGNAADHLYQPD